MPTDPVTSLSVEMRRTADGSLYQFGVNVGGAYIVFASRKTGGVDDQIALAAEQAKQAAAAAAAAAAAVPVAPAPVAPSFPVDAQA